MTKKAKPETEKHNFPKNLEYCDLKSLFQLKIQFFQQSFFSIVAFLHAILSDINVPKTSKCDFCNKIEFCFLDCEYTNRPVSTSKFVILKIKNIFIPIFDLHDLSITNVKILVLDPKV